MAKILPKALRISASDATKHQYLLHGKLGESSTAT